MYGRYHHGMRHNPPLQEINERTVLDAILNRMPSNMAQMLLSQLGRQAMEEQVKALLIQKLREKVQAIVAAGG